MRGLLWWLIGCGGSDTPVTAPPAPEAKPVEAPAEAAEEAEAPTGLNRPPKIKDVLFRPEHPTAGQTIETRILGEDPDEDAVDIDLVWVVNGDRWLDRTERTLADADLKRGDVVQIEVTVSDGTNTVTELSRKLEIGNTPPELLTKPEDFADINGLEVQARDVDGDTLRYTLEGAPAGLTIDERGVITYEGSQAEKAGTYKVTLVVDDGHTGTAKLSFGMSVSGGQTEQRVRKGSEAAGG